MKKTKFSIAVVLSNPKNTDEVLVVKRPDDDDSLPGVWGLPAVTVKEGELPEVAVIRLGEEKLCTQIKANSYIGIQQADRGDYELVLMDIQAVLQGGEPSVENAQTIGTKYVEQQWASDLSILNVAASKGSLCSRILLESKGIGWD